jgi:hypothetical protein
VVTLVIGASAAILAAGWRATHCPQPGGATVNAVSTVAGYPNESTAEVTVTIVNPGAAPVLVGLSPRRPGPTAACGL